MHVESFFFCTLILCSFFLGFDKAKSKIQINMKLFSSTKVKWEQKIVYLFFEPDSLRLSESPNETSISALAAQYCKKRKESETFMVFHPCKREGRQLDSWTK